MISLGSDIGLQITRTKVKTGLTTWSDSYLLIGIDNNLGFNLERHRSSRERLGDLPACLRVRSSRLRTRRAVWTNFGTSSQALTSEFNLCDSIVKVASVDHVLDIAYTIILAERDMKHRPRARLEFELAASEVTVVDFK
ncbi:hypothetical protein [Natrinema sp. DC36]|uniref:hypothetical protein n=1 Tax=Natrinema sp. DC36 TaxID=2878680 RepID=UPI001CEFDF7A|nr:hypothetical protein [Natrinema sp. DC36]